MVAFDARASDVDAECLVMVSSFGGHSRHVPCLQRVARVL